MTKKHEQIKPGTKPDKSKKQDLSEFKSALRGVTFRGAKRGYHVPQLAIDKIALAAAHHSKRNPELSLNQCLSMAFTAYWQLYDERKT